MIIPTTQSLSLNKNYHFIEVQRLNSWYYHHLQLVDGLLKNKKVFLLDAALTLLHHDLLQ
jgi:hypothetical protein